MSKLLTSFCKPCLASGPGPHAPGLAGSVPNHRPWVQKAQQWSYWPKVQPAQPQTTGTGSVQPSPKSLILGLSRSALKHWPRVYRAQCKTTGPGSV